MGCKALSLAVGARIHHDPFFQELLGYSGRVVISEITVRRHDPPDRSCLQQIWRHELCQKGMFPYISLLIVIVLGRQTPIRHHQCWGISRLRSAPKLRHIIVDRQCRDIVLDTA